MQTVNDRFEELEKKKRLQNDKEAIDTTKTTASEVTPSTKHDNESTCNPSIVHPSPTSKPADNGVSAADLAIMEYARESIMPVKMRNDRTVSITLLLFFALLFFCIIIIIIIFKI